MNEQKTIIFDLDGTLVDSAPDLLDSLNNTILPQGLAPMTLQNMGHLLGQGIQPMLKKAFDSQNKKLTKQQTDELQNIFLTFYQKNIANKTKLFENCLDTLGKLQNKNFALAICTNKRTALTNLLLEKLNIKEKFAAITCGDSFDFMKPDPRHLLATIKLCNGTPNRSIMIGDSINDILAAKNGNVSSIAVSFGYSEHDANTLGADLVIDNYLQLIAAIENITSKWN